MRAQLSKCTSHDADVECDAATTLQSIWRGRAARLTAQQRIQAIIKLQVS